MSDGERLVVMLEARISEFEKRMAKAERTGTGSYRKLRSGSSSATRAMEQDMLRSSSRINQALATTSAGVGSFAKAFAGGLVGGIVGAAFAGFSRNVDGVIRQVAQIGDEAKRAGVEVEAFQQWGYVARQNRIDIGALTDGFKELNLRADEFVVTGKGSAAEAFQRLGYTANDLKQKLQDPSNLMLEIIGRLEGLDKAAQIRIADELFGGTGGERFVELLSQGEAGIRKVMGEAKSAGVVIDAELVQRADELDKRFAAIQERLAGGFKAAVVTAGEAVLGAGGAGQLSELMHDLERARAILGGDLADALINNAALIEDNAAGISELNQRTWELTNTADELATAYFDLADAAFALGDAETAQALVDAGVAMDDLVDKFKRGEINVDQLATGLLDVRIRADEAVGAISDADALSMSSIIGEVNALEGALASAAGMAQGLWSWLAGIAGAGEGGEAGLSRNPFDMGGEPMASSPRPQSPGVDSLGDWQAVNTPKSKGGGGGRGGGGRGNSRLDALVEDLKTEKQILEEWYAKSLELLNGATEAQLEALGGKHEAIERLELDHKQRLAEIEEMTNAGRLSEMGNFFGAMAELTAAGGEKLVKATRVFGAAEALVNTFRAQSQVLADPRLGFFGKMAAYASIGAAGMGLVAALKGGGKGSGGSAGAASAASASKATAAQQAAPVRVLVQGVKPGDILTGQSLIDFTTAVQKELKNRGVIFSYV